MPLGQDFKRIAGQPYRLFHHVFTPAVGERIPNENNRQKIKYLFILFLYSTEIIIENIKNHVVQYKLIECA